MPIISKTVSIDFGGNNPDIGKLHVSINADPAISATCERITSFIDDISIHMDTDLTGPETTALNALIAAHDNTPIITYDNNIMATLTATKTKNSAYTKIGQFIFPGASTMRVKGTGYKDTGVVSYSIKIYNSTANNMMAEATFTNTAEEVIDVGICSNVPTDVSIIHVLLKRTGGGSAAMANITSMVAYYS